MYRCVIIDDEAHAIEGIELFLRNRPDIKILASFTEPVTALREIPNLGELDLILVDVDMPEITGIELSREIRAFTKKLVFTTAHSRYAYDAFEISADGYLLKPYSLSKFLSLIQKLLPEEKDNQNQADDLLTANDFLFVKSRDENLQLIKVLYKDIVAIESKLNYVQIHTVEKSMFTYMTLAETATILAHLKQFIQFQRSFILNTLHIQSIDGNQIKMINGLKINVGQFYKKEFNDFVDQYLLKTKRK